MKLKSFKDLPEIPRPPKPEPVSWFNTRYEDLSFADRFVEAIHSDYVYFNQKEVK